MFQNTDKQGLVLTDEIRMETNEIIVQKKIVLESGMQIDT